MSKLKVEKDENDFFCGSPETSFEGFENKEEMCTEYLKSIADKELINILRNVLRNREFEWEGVYDEYGYPSYSTILCVLKKVIL